MKIIQKFKFQSFFKKQYFLCNNFNNLDPYSELELMKGSSPNQIKRAYLELCKKCISKLKHKIKRSS